MVPPHATPRQRRMHDATRAGAPLLRQLRQREMPCFDAELLLTAYAPGGHRARLSIGQLHDAATQRDASSRRESAAALSERAVARSVQSSAQSVGPVAMYPVFSHAI